MNWKNVKSFKFIADNGDNYLITYDHTAGVKNRYTVLLWRSGRKATIIGKELPLGFSKKLVKDRIKGE